MESYEQVLKITKEYKTISDSITALGKIRANTEDDELIKRIDNAIESLQNDHYIIKKAKSLPICMDTFDYPPNILNLIDYCKKKAAGIKKQS